MKKSFLTFTIVFVFCTFGYSQFLDKLKKKVEETISSTQTTTANQNATKHESTANLTGAKGSVSNNFQNEGREWYISTKGSGQLGTRERPSKDLGNIIHHLKPNDVIYIAGGTYLGKGENGSDHITVPVKIYGGFNESFSKRDPWGEHQTILTGTNIYQKSTLPRLYIATNSQREDNGHYSFGSEIVVDGVIVDHGPRNRYHEDKDLAIRRMASPTENENPSPENGGIVIVASKFMNVLVENCIVMNTAPTQGALAVNLFHGGEGKIINNLCVNNTGYGIHLKSGYAGDDESLHPKFEVKNNTVLFSWKHDPIASYGGSALATDKLLKANVEQNVFAFSHMGGIFSKLTPLTLVNNIFTGNKMFDLKEENSEMFVNEILDESMHIDQYSQGNRNEILQFPLHKRFAEIYAGRQEISRAEVDAAVQVSNSWSNQVRSMLGMNLQGSTVKMDAEVFLPRILPEEVVPLGLEKYKGAGCSKPKPNVF